MPSDHHDHAFDATWWDQHYQCSAGSLGQPTPYVTDDLANLEPGSILDAGCGTGADAMWLADRGWDVTAVDISPTAIEQARALALGTPSEYASRITWLATDVLSWDPERRFDVVLSQYVHPDEPFARFVDRLGRLVARGGTLLVVGHDHSDAHAASHAPHDASVDVDNIAGVLNPIEWTIEVAEQRERRVERSEDHQSLTLNDIVVRARRRP